MKLVAALAMLLAAACGARALDATTGLDGRVRGARPIALAGGHAEVRDFVSSPAGDRVDWKLVELPRGEQGTVTVTLAWMPLHPGDRVAATVHGPWGAQLAELSARPAVIEHATDRVYLRIYARGRRDAGAYLLTIDYVRTGDAPPCTGECPPIDPVFRNPPPP